MKAALMRRGKRAGKAQAAALLVLEYHNILGIAAHVSGAAHEAA